MIGKPARERKRLNIFRDLGKRVKYAALKRRAEDGKWWQKLRRAGSLLSRLRYLKKVCGGPTCIWELKFFMKSPCPLAT